MFFYSEKLQKSGLMNEHSFCMFDFVRFILVVLSTRPSRFESCRCWFFVICLNTEAYALQSVMSCTFSLSPRFEELEGIHDHAGGLTIFASTYCRHHQLPFDKWIFLAVTVSAYAVFWTSFRRRSLICFERLSAQPFCFFHGQFVFLCAFAWSCHWL